MTSSPIDLVYLWVDGNDPIQQESLRRELVAAGKDVSFLDTERCRFVDSQELRYSLRSALENAPWIRHIIIVTNGQVPKWLDTSHPRIRMVFHSEFMPSAALPTFNSEAIETCLADIPGLSERFLYANDDFFFGKPVDPSFFFDEGGRPFVFGRQREWNRKKVNRSMYFSNMHYSAELMQKHFGIKPTFQSSHNIIGYDKNILQDCRKEFEEEFFTTCHRKFREENSVQRIIYDYYAIERGESTFKECSNPKDNNVEHIALRGYHVMKESFKNMPTLFCINDEEGTLERHREELSVLLDELFPNKAEWEKELPDLEFCRSKVRKKECPSLLLLLKFELLYMHARAMVTVLQGEARKNWMLRRSRLRFQVEEIRYWRRKEGK